MQVIKAFYPVDSEFKNFEVAISDWYCKPAILGSLAVKFGCLFLTCSKTGCKQYKPIWCSRFPVHNIDIIDYKENLNWIIIEFNDFAKPLSMDKFQIERFYE